MARAIALPGKNRPMRFPSYPALERTATMGFNATTTISVGNSSTLGKPTKGVLMRQATYPFWWETRYSGASMYGVTWRAEYKSEGAAMFSTFETIPGPLRHYNPSVAYTADASTVGVNYAAIATQPSTFDYPLIGVDLGTGSQEWVWAPTGSNIHMILTRSISGVSMDGGFSLEEWDSPGQYSLRGQYSAVAVGGDRSIVASVAGRNTWVRIKSVSAYISDSINETLDISLMVGFGTFSFSNSTTSAPTFTATATPGVTITPLVPFAVPKEFVNSKLPWYSTRTTAAAVLLTNTTKVLNKEGTFLWGRIAPSVTSVWDVNESYINGLHPAEKAFLPMEAGTYSFCPPSTDLAEFWDYSSNSTYAAAVPVVRLDNGSLCNVVFATDTDGGTSLSMNVDWHIEFRTSSTLFDIGLCNAPIEALHSAQLAVVKAGFFYDNFDHVAIINSIVKAFASIHPLLHLAAPMARGLMGAASSASTMLSRKTKPPAATSARRSGIVGPSRPSAARSASVAGSSRVRAWRASVKPPTSRASSVGSRRSRGRRSRRR